MILWRLRAEGRRLLTPELVSGRLERWPEAQYAALLDPHERPIELARFDGVVERAIERTRPHDPGLDAILAEDLHLSLPLSRREAADPAVFRFLTVVQRPELVRHRWENRSWATARSRFWASGTRPDSNSIGRLWWIAELTRKGSDYGLTRTVLMRQPLVNNLFVRSWSSHRPAVEAAVEVLSGAPSHEIEATLTLLTKALSTRLLEALDRASLLELLRSIRAHVRRARVLGT